MTDANGKILEYNKANPKHLEGFLASNGLCHQELAGCLKDI
jgi:hypothetical protein